MRPSNGKLVQVGCRGTASGRRLRAGGCPVKCPEPARWRLWPRARANADRSLTVLQSQPGGDLSARRRQAVAFHETLDKSEHFQLFRAEIGHVREIPDGCLVWSLGAVWRRQAGMLRRAKRLHSRADLPATRYEATSATDQRPARMHARPRALSCALARVAVELVVQRLQAAAEHGGRATLVAFAVVQRHFDQRALGFIQARAERNVQSCRPRLLDGSRRVRRHRRAPDRCRARRPRG